MIRTPRTAMAAAARTWLQHYHARRSHQQQSQSAPACVDRHQGVVAGHVVRPVITKATR